MSERASPIICELVLLQSPLLFGSFRKLEIMRLRKPIHFQSVLHLVEWNVQMAGKKSSKSMHNDITNLCIWKLFNVQIEIPKVIELNKLIGLCMLLAS